MFLWLASRPCTARLCKYFHFVDTACLACLATAECNLPLCPSRVWFIDRLLGAARPLSLASSVVKAVKEERDQVQKQIR